MCNPDSNQLCAGGCGFFGSANLNNMCSVCFKRTHGEEEFKLRVHRSAPSSPIPSTEPQHDGSTPPESALLQPLNAEILDKVVSNAMASLSEQTAEARFVEARVACADVRPEECALEVAASAAEAPRRTVNRCTQCSKKVGLTGFGCRCGGTFCSMHRLAPFLSRAGTKA